MRFYTDPVHSVLGWLGLATGFAAVYFAWWIAASLEFLRALCEIGVLAGTATRRDREL